ncbi:hypothetical protein SBBP2_500004 [Burkholderiales bacterium]|nr:hypothetical protein SBBP2_500004 [Burkholderiales bacterium]
MSSDSNFQPLRQCRFRVAQWTGLQNPDTNQRYGVSWLSGIFFYHSVSRSCTTGLGKRQRVS